MKLKRWQLVWTLLVVLWLAASASPMAILMLRGDTEQLVIYFGMWIAVVLIPTGVVYLVGLLFGTFAGRSASSQGHPQRKSWKTLWLLASIAWALLVIFFCVIADTPMNPFHHFAWPLAATAVLLLVLLPPTLVYAVAFTVAHFRKGAEDR